MRFTGYLDREAVLGMTGIALTNRAVRPLVGDVVTSFTTLLSADNRLKNSAVSRSIEPELIGMLRLGVFGHFFLMALRAVFRCRIESNREAIVLKSIKIVFLCLVTRETTDTVFSVL